MPDLFAMGQDILLLPQHNSHSRDRRDLSNTDAFFMLREIDHDPNTVWLVGKSNHPPLRF